MVWTRKQKLRNVLVKDTAIELAKQLRIENVFVSNTCMDRFYQRLKIVYKTMSGGYKSVDPETTKHWKERHFSHTKDYNTEVIFKYGWNFLL